MTLVQRLRERAALEMLHGSARVGQDYIDALHEIERLRENALKLHVLAADIADVVVERDNGYRRCLACDHQWHMEDDPMHDDECALFRLEAEVTIQRTS